MSDVEINTKGWDLIRKRMREAAYTGAKVGILASKGGNSQHSEGLTILEIAAIHEFGSPVANIPERSFIRRTFRDRQSELAAISRKLATKVIVGGMPITQALSILGAWGAGAVKQTVTAGPHIPPPLKPETIRRKKSDRPLIDTGRMLNAVTWELEQGIDVDVSEWY